MHRGDGDLTEVLRKIIPHGVSCVGFVGEILVAARTCSIEVRTDGEPKLSPPSGCSKLDKVHMLLDRLDQVCLPKIPKRVQNYSQVSVQF